MKTPTWDEILEFLRIDRWTRDRATGRDFFEKVLPNGEILQTHASRSGDRTISPGRFTSILADALRVSETEFWDVLRTRDPATRPSRSPEPPPASLPLWLVRALERDAGLGLDQITELDEQAARTLLDATRSRPPE